MANIKLGGGDEEQHALLAGFEIDTSGGTRSGSRGVAGFTVALVIERIARVASIVIGSGGGSGGGGGGGCVWHEALLPSGLRAKDAESGSALVVLADEGEAFVGSEVRAARSSLQPCVRLVTQSGVRLTCSLSTPTTTRVGGALKTIPVADCLGVEVPVLIDGAFRWESIEAIEPRGDLWVRLIDCADATFAAGDDFGRYIFTHNKLDWDDDLPGR